MKSLLIIILSLPSIALAQREFETKNMTYSVGAFSQYSAYKRSEGIEGGVQFKNHWLNLGVGYNFGGVKNNGSLSFDYNYLPNSYSNRFNLLFDLNLSMYSEFGYKFKSSYSRFGVHGSFGFNFNASQHIFIKPIIGYGIEYSFRYSDPDPSVLFRLSVGYRF